ncbi:SDR family NAD(P)-dependent oxidoreductase [Corynebacterium halotolerans]|uniref:SDR family NAD(P)-dependent oxidoreductase n=1 Tax=Corynebacterium halotolerans TaxID=225326 RepID=UPI003CFB80D6
MSLSSKIAVVTGAGSGMGLATVRAFLEEGATVYALDISPDNLDGNSAQRRTSRPLPSTSRTPRRSTMLSTG